MNRAVTYALALLIVAVALGAFLWRSGAPRAPQNDADDEIGQSFEGEGDPARMTLNMKTWVWIGAAQNDGTQIAPLRADVFTLAFRDDGVFAATTDCNQVTGAYTTSGQQLAFGADMAATRMFCDGSQEAVFTALLAETASYAFTSRGELVLALKTGGSMTFR